MNEFPSFYCMSGQFFLIPSCLCLIRGVIVLGVDVIFVEKIESFCLFCLKLANA